MKAKNYVLLVSFVFMALIFASCGKDGATGPQGPIGPTGSTGVPGATGPTGPAGANGSVIYSGNTTPAAATGAVGDFYLDLATGVLYGPKTASGWGSGFSLKGQTGATGATGAVGATGAAGNTIISGTGAPSATTGNTGDYYLDDSSYLLYGPKTASGWGTATSLQGPAGNANVEYSGWNFATNIRDTTIDESSLVVANLAASSITTNDLSNASIQVYLNFGAGVFPMPYTSDAGGKTSTMSFLPQVGQILITRYTADGTGSISLSSVIQYRYVIIPGSVLVAANNHINLKDYEAVRRYFRIPN